MMSGWRHYLFYFFTSITIFYHTKLFQRFPRPHGLLCFRSRSFYSPAHRLFFPLLSLSRFPSLSSFQFGFRESFRPPFVQRKLYSFLFILRPFFIIIVRIIVIKEHDRRRVRAQILAFVCSSPSPSSFSSSPAAAKTRTFPKREKNQTTPKVVVGVVARLLHSVDRESEISADGGGSSHVGIARGSKSFGRKRNSSSSSSSSTIVVYIVVVYRRINTFPSSSGNTFVNSKDEKKTSDECLRFSFSSNDKSKKSDLGFYQNPKRTCLKKKGEHTVLRKNRSRRDKKRKHFTTETTTR